MKATGYLLSSLKYGFRNDSFINCIKEGGRPDYSQKAIGGELLVIGFCETATALGMSVASSIKDSYYQATTREKILGVNQLLSFEESHSHASTHYMFNNEKSLYDFKEVILVDDEITTGKSLLHLIEEIIKKSYIRDFSVMTILDWRDNKSKREYEEFAKAHNISITVYSIITGLLLQSDDEIKINDDIPIIDASADSYSLCLFDRTELQINGSISESYLQHSGMLGVRQHDIEDMEICAEKASERILELQDGLTKVLVLGHGENIYIPSRIAAYIERMGVDVRFRTTSRTPIYCDGEIIKNAVRFASHGDWYNFYNLHETETCDAVIMIANNEFRYKLCDNLVIFNA